jgi:hypothetical protein
LSMIEDRCLICGFVMQNVVECVVVFAGLEVRRFLKLHFWRATRAEWGRRFSLTTQMVAVGGRLSRVRRVIGVD